MLRNSVSSTGFSLVAFALMAFGLNGEAKAADPTANCQIQQVGGGGWQIKGFGSTSGLPAATNYEIRIKFQIYNVNGHQTFQTNSIFGTTPNPTAPQTYDTGWQGFTPTQGTSYLVTVSVHYLENRMPKTLGPTESMTVTPIP